MSDLFWLTDDQVRRIEPRFPLSRGAPRVDDRRVLPGIIFVIRNGLHSRDASSDYGPQIKNINKMAPAKIIIDKRKVLKPNSECCTNVFSHRVNPSMPLACSRKRNIETAMI